MNHYKNFKLSSKPKKLGSSLHKIVETNAQTHPYSAALIYGKEIITYKNLNHAANCTAMELSKMGVGPGSYIPTLLPRTPELIISLLGILKTGAAYALLDPCWSIDRLREVLKTLKPPLLIGNKDATFVEGLTVWNPTKEYSNLGNFSPAYEVLESSPCSVFFTSGTTGQPKGVISSHKAITRLFKENSIVKFTPQTVIPLAAALPWDAFSLELWGALLNGGTAWIVDQPYLSAEALRRGILHYGVTTVWMTSSLFNMIVEEDIKSFKDLYQVMTGGERLSVPHVKKFIKSHPQITLINGYGPVESTVFATTHQITIIDCELPTGIPIGTPVPNTHIYVLNKQDCLCEDEQIGEICISGDGLAICYINDPKLTSKKFKEININGTITRIYRTGDLGFWKDGVLHYSGREDRQVKIRGHRIELAEVESQIIKLIDNVKSCRVIARKDASDISQELIAFCILRKKDISLDDTLTFLKSKLVHYHCPKVLVIVDKFPLSPQGKLDELALLNLVPNQVNEILIPSIENNNFDHSIENTVSKIFCSVLNNKFVPPDIPLKELGATSLDIGRICIRLCSQLNRTVPLSWLYEYPTVFSLSMYLNSTSQSTSFKYLPNSGLSSIQIMYLTQHLINPDSLTSHCLMIWHIKGDLKIKKLEQAIEYVHQNNKALRSLYVLDHIPKQFGSILAPKLKILPNQPSEKEAMDTLRTVLSRKLDPTQGIIWKAAIVQIDNNNTSFFGCVIHHIAFDGYSEHLFSGDLVSKYNSITGDEESSYASSPVDEAIPVLSYAPSEINITEHINHLIKQLEDTPEITWPYNKASKVLSCTKNDELLVILNKQLVSKIDKFAKDNFFTRFEILLYFWAKSLSTITGQDDFCIGIPIRQRHTPELEKVIGCHINMLCIRLRGSAFDNGIIGLQHASSAVQHALKNQDVPFTQLIQNLKPSSIGRPPLFQTLFSLQDNPLPELNIENLETEFIRHPYLDLPLELHAEIWLEKFGELRLTISHRLECVSSEVSQQLADNFKKGLSNFLNDTV